MKYSCLCVCFFLLWEAVSSDGENLIIEVIYEWNYLDKFIAQRVIIIT